MWMFTNIGMNPDIDNIRIPNHALDFVYEVSRHVPDLEINRLINKDIYFFGLIGKGNLVFYLA